VTRIDFYILADQAASDAADIVACRLAAKAFSLGNAVYLHTGSDAHARQLDALLWTFQQGSFVPHMLASAWQPAGAGVPSPVLLGHEPEPPDNHWDLLINVAEAVPACFSRYQRVAELVAAGEQCRQRGRERYQFYRDRGYELQTHRL
jgi:DNA polymerase-3 subunit chi